jgi:hypothetical protein
MPLKLSDPIRFMIFVLREFDLFFVRNLFKKTFDESENEQSNARAFRWRMVLWNPDGRRHCM